MGQYAAGSGMTPGTLDQGQGLYLLGQAANQNNLLEQVRAQVAGQQSVANTALRGVLDSNTRQYQAAMDANAKGLESQRIQSGAQRYGSDTQLAGTKYASDAETQRQQALMNEKLARFNQIFPFFQSQLGGGSAGVGGGGGLGGGGLGGPIGGGGFGAPLGGGSAGVGGYGGYGGGVGGSVASTRGSDPIGSTGGVGGGLGRPVAAAPPVQAPSGNYGYGVGGGGGGVNAAPSPVYSEGQIQQQVNAAVGRNDAKTAGAMRRQTQDLAGRGLGPESPLAMALRNQAMGAGLRAGTDVDRETRMAAAQANADDRLARYQTGAQTDAARFASDRSARANEYGSQVAAQASQYGSQAAAQASQYGNNLDYQARMAATAASQRNALLAALSGLMG